MSLQIDNLSTLLMNVELFESTDTECEWHYVYSLRGPFVRILATKECNQGKYSAP